MNTTSVDRNQMYNNAEKTVDRVDGGIRSVVDSAKENSNKVVDEVKHMAESGKNMAKDQIQKAEEVFKTQSEALTDYIKNQPVRSVLIALGAGYIISCLNKK